jgi:hypothetical protein
MELAPAGNVDRRDDGSAQRPAGMELETADCPHVDGHYVLFDWNRWVEAAPDGPTAW